MLRKLLADSMLKIYATQEKKYIHSYLKTDTPYC